LFVAARGAQPTAEVEAAQYQLNLHSRQHAQSSESIGARMACALASQCLLRQWFDRQAGHSL
jgi:hypothetical protein